MRNCLVVYSVCCIYLSVGGLKLAHSGNDDGGGGVEIVQNTNSHCTPNGSQNFSAAEEVHGRNKRYLLFEKGAAVSVTTAVVKTIVPGIPRGFNIICEESLYYDLPTSFSPTMPRKALMKPIKKTELPSKQEGIKRKNDFQKYEIPNYVDRNLYDFQKYYNSAKYEFPQYTYQKYHPYLKRRRFRSAENTDDSAPFLDIEAIFFQQIESFARRHGFNERYCIMRTICESQHILFAKGHSLFHDAIRIIIKFSLPMIKKNWKYLNAFNTKTLMECANLYGPHCKISFIDFFTYKFHGNS